MRSSVGAVDRFEGLARSSGSGSAAVMVALAAVLPARPVCPPGPPRVLQHPPDAALPGPRLDFYHWGGIGSVVAL